MNSTATHAEKDVRRREDGRMLRRARDRESLCEIRTVLDRVYGRRAWQCSKIGGPDPEAILPTRPPLDSRFRGNDKLS